ncbi:MAG: hypothetical protein JW801_14100 [Bacteroidales bacterium]|nr:hypothetical protein [Bacteroidales bacterium]
MNTSSKTLKQIPDSLLKSLSGKKIFFGHQSVGYEIIGGVSQLMKDYPDLQLNIVETRDTSDFNQAVFAHSRIGKNRHPELKILDFCSIMNGGMAQKADIVFFKFCFVDVDRNTDIERIFNEYIAKTREIQNLNPDLKIIHLTVPVRVKPDGFKGFLNRVLLRDHNINRNNFNNMLRKHFPPQDLFDLALYESRSVNKERISYKMWGTQVFSLDPDITYDGGHLNDKGARYIAEKLLIKLIDSLQE